MIVARCNVHTQKESSFQINSPTSSRAIGRHLTDTLNSVSLFLVNLPPRTRDGRPIQQRILCSFELLALKSSWDLALLYNGLNISRTLRFFGSPDITHKRSRFPFLSGTLSWEHTNCTHACTIFRATGYINSIFAFHGDSKSRYTSVVLNYSVLF